MDKNIVELVREDTRTVGGYLSNQTPRQNTNGLQGYLMLQSMMRYASRTNK